MFEYFREYIVYILLDYSTDISSLRLQYKIDNQIDFTGCALIIVFGR